MSDLGRGTFMHRHRKSSHINRRSSPNLRNNVDVNVKEIIARRYKNPRFDVTGHKRTHMRELKKINGWELSCMIDKGLERVKKGKDASSIRKGVRARQRKP